MIDINKVDYPHIKHMYNVEPNIEAFIGRQLYVQKKLDGSNAGFYLNDKDEVMVRSRNATIADKDMFKWAEQSGHLPSIKELLLNARDWNSEYVLFGELYGKGTSPTRIKKYDAPFFVAFDLWSEKEQGFVSYVNAYQNCSHFNIPFVETVFHGVFSTVAHLQSTLDGLLEAAEVERIEGYVIKSWDYKQSELALWNVGKRPLMFKHKIDTPRLEKIPNVRDTDRVVLPVLPDSEIYGAINRVKMDNGSDNFKRIDLTMPKIAIYLKDECNKHNCSMPKNIMRYYQEVLKDE